MANPTPKNPEIRIFTWTQHVSKATPAIDYCTSADAARLVQRGLAKRCLKGFAIQLLKPEPRTKKIFEIEINDMSCKMGPRVILALVGAIDGNRKHVQSLLDGWLVNHAPAGI